MLKHADDLLTPDRYFSGQGGNLGSTIEELHADMSGLHLPSRTPEAVRRSHDGVRHAYIYSYFSYDLLTVAAAQTFPCLELALRMRLGIIETSDRKGRPPTLHRLLKAARERELLSADPVGLVSLRNLFAHGPDVVLNPPMFLIAFRLVTAIIQELFADRDEAPREDRST